MNSISCRCINTACDNAIAHHCLLTPHISSLDIDIYPPSNIIFIRHHHQLHLHQCLSLTLNWREKLMKFSRPMEISSLIGVVPDNQASLAKDQVSRAKHHLASLVRDLQSLVRDHEEVGVTAVVNTKGVSK